MTLVNKHNVNQFKQFCIQNWYIRMFDSSGDLG
jgi:hypothetical protein